VTAWDATAISALAAAAGAIQRGVASFAAVGVVEARRVEAR